MLIGLGSAWEHFLRYVSYELIMASIYKIKEEKLKAMMMKNMLDIIRNATAVLLAFFIAAVCNGQENRSAKVQGTKVQGTGQVNPGEVNLEHSRVFIKVGKVGLGHEHAIVGNLKEGEMALTKGGNGRLVFDMTSFDADSEFARKYIGLEGTTDEGTRKQVNENMLGKAVLDVKKYPEAIFELKEIKPLGTKSSRGFPEYVLAGDFTLHGTRRAIEFQVDLQEEKGWYHMRGGFEILQSQYGIKPYSKMGGVVGVTDKLIIYGDLWIAP